MLYYIESRITIFVIIYSLGFIAFSQTVYTYRSPESSSDLRYNYDNELLKLALDKTVYADGEYRLVPSPVMNFKRMNFYLEQGSLVNPIFKQSATNEICRKYDYIDFPVDLGIVGYRYFFVAPNIKEEFKSVKVLEDLKKYSIIQGTGWSDVDILRDSMLNVREIPKYENLFIEISKNKADLLPRGMNEILIEMDEHSGLDGLSFNETIILYYPLPRFFFTSKGNSVALDRVRRGLLIAYSDGSLRQLWDKYYLKSINLLGVQDKTIISIENPTIDRLNSSYEMYLFK